MVVTSHRAPRVSIATWAGLPALVLAVALWLLAVSTSGWAQQGATPYRMGAGDLIKVRIVAWDSDKLAFVPFDEVGGEYQVGSDGNVMMPLLGPIEAAGKAPATLAEDISAVVQFKVGLRQSPSTSVEILRYRPIYVLGDVARPGAYEYRPGLTAVQAVALAGGIFRLGTEDRSELLTAIRTSGSFRELGMDRARMQLRAARLRAESEGQESFDRPQGLGSPGGEAVLADMFEQEKTLFASRRDTLARAVEELAAARELLETEIAAREEKMSGLQSQMELAREAADNMQTLVDKGLARRENLFLLQQRLTDLEARVLDAETGIYRAQQEIAKLNRDETDLITGRRLETLRELQSTEAEIDRLTTRENVNRRILRETDAGAVLAGGAVDEPVSVVRYQILRDTGQGSEPIPADRASALHPLDVLEIILENPTEPPSDSSEGG